MTITGGSEKISIWGTFILTHAVLSTEYVEFLTGIAYYLL